MNVRIERSWIPAFVLVSVLAPAACGTQDLTESAGAGSSDAGGSSDVVIAEDVVEDTVDVLVPDALGPSACELPESTMREADFHFEHCLFYSEGLTEIVAADGEQAALLEEIQNCIDQSELSYDLSTVDFEVSKVVMTSVWIGSTCGLEIRGARVFESETHVGLEMRAFDRSGGCESVCASRDGVSIGAVVPRGLEVVECYALDGACDE